eukprot:822632-Amphidinium_carterae.1
MKSDMSNTASRAARQQALQDRTSVVFLMAPPDMGNKACMLQCKHTPTLTNMHGLTATFAAL